jgi:hypothetical protein
VARPTAARQSPAAAATAALADASVNTPACPGNCWLPEAALVAAVILLVLSVLGFVHLRRTPAEAELLSAGQRA